MTFYEFTHSPPTLEGEMLLQSIAIVSGQGRFRRMTPNKIFDFIAKQMAEVKATGCRNCREAGEPAEGLWPLSVI